MDARGIAPVPPPPKLRSFISSDNLPKPSWRTRSISIDDIRLKFNRRGPPRDTAKPQKTTPRDPDHRATSKIVSYRPCQQVYGKGKAKQRGIHADDMELFEAHEATDKEDRAKGRPRPLGEPIRKNQVAKKEVNIKERCEGSDDESDTGAFIRSPAPSVPPLPRKSSKRVRIKAASDTGALSRQVSGRQRIPQGNVKSVVDWAYATSKSDRTSMDDRPPTPPPKDKPVAPRSRQAQAEEPVHTAQIDTFPSQGTQKSYFKHSSFAQKVKPRRSMTQLFRKITVEEEADACSNDSTISIHPLTDDYEVKYEGASTIPDVGLSSKQQDAGAAEPTQGKQSFFQNSALFRRLAAAKPVQRTRPKSQRFQGLYNLLSQAEPNMGVPVVPKVPEIFATAQLQEAERNNQATPALENKDRTLKKFKVRETAAGERVFFGQRLGRSRRRIHITASYIQSKKDVAEKLRVKEYEEYVAEKDYLFQLLNTTREKRDGDVRQREIKRLQRAGQTVPDNWQLPPVSKLEKLKFDTDLDTEAQTTADEQDLHDLEHLSPRSQTEETLLPEYTELWEDEDTKQVVIVGPAHQSAASAGHFWDEGARHLHPAPIGRQARLPAATEEEYQQRCPCQNYQVWSAITDPSFRYVGFARTKRQRRWVVHLAKETPRDRIERMAAGEELREHHVVYHDILPGSSEDAASGRLESTTTGSESPPAEPQTARPQNPVLRDTLATIDDFTASLCNASPSPSPSMYEQARPHNLQRSNTTASSYYGDDDDEPPLTPIEPVPPLRLRGSILTNAANAPKLAEQGDQDGHDEGSAFDLENPAWPGEAGPGFLLYRPTVRSSSLPFHDVGDDNGIERHPTVRMPSRKPVPSRQRGLSEAGDFMPVL